MPKTTKEIAPWLALLATALLAQSIALTPVAQAANAPVAQATAAVSDEAILKEVTGMEMRFFARQYPNDPLEKRLERVELMVFGGTQAGSNAERLARLKKAIVDRKAAESSAKKGPATATKEPAGKSSQYPVVSDLEGRVLHKSYPTEVLGSRLSRLEKKVFGSDSPTMAYADRVDRLKKTLGVGPSAQAPRAATVLGPAPKARPRGQYPQGWGFSSPPVIGDRDPFGDESTFGLGQGMGFPSNINKMLKQMDQQMEQMDQMPGGGGWSFHQEYTYDPKNGWTEHHGSTSPTRPNVPNNSEQPQLQPQPFHQPHLAPRTLPFGNNQNNGGLPPYSDPNSI